MSELEPYQLKRRIIPGRIEVHPVENSLVINYTVQATIIGDNGAPVGGDKKNMQKIIRVKTLTSTSNISALAREVVEKCKLIQPEKIKDVEQQLYYLQTRSSSKSTASGGTSLQKQMEISSISDGLDQLPSMDNIESFIEGLYEEMPDKINSTRNLLQLARSPENMDALIRNEALVSALARVLREDGKKSMELVTNIIYIFFCFSNFSHFHPIITANKLGDMCLRVADQEIQRYNIWIQDLDKLEAKVALSADNATYKKELESEHRKFQTMQKKQDQLLFVSFHLLLNLAEDLSIEVKIVKRDIVRYLIIMMDRNTPELLILAMTFLKKLTVFRENKDELVKNADDFLTKLDKILQIQHDGLLILSLRLVLNLCHDESFRLATMKKGMLPKFVQVFSSCMQNNTILELVEQVLYMLSVDEKSKAMFAYSDCVILVLKSILESKGEKVNLELMALGINLALDESSALIFVKDNGVKFLLKRGIKTRDILILKMVRNISAHAGNCKLPFLEFIDDIMNLFFKSLNNPEILVELLGILGNLNIADFDFAKLSETYKLHDFIASALSRAASSSKTTKPTIDQRGGLADDDDITLEVVVFLGTMAADDGMASIIAKTNIVESLLELMMGKWLSNSAKEEDDEIILQITYCIFNMLLHETTRNILVSKTQIVSYLIDLLYDRNIEIRKMCDACLDIIIEIDEEWVKKIKLQKFQWHNSEWLSCMTAAQNQDGAFEESAVIYANRKIGEAGFEEGEEFDSDDEERLFQQMLRNEI